MAIWLAQVRLEAAGLLGTISSGISPWILQKLTSLLEVPSLLLQYKNMAKGASPSQNCFYPTENLDIKVKLCVYNLMSSLSQLQIQIQSRYTIPSIDKLNKHRNKYNKSSGTFGSLCSQTKTHKMHSSLVCDMQMLLHRILELAQIWTGCGGFPPSTE